MIFFVGTNVCIGLDLLCRIRKQAIAWQGDERRYSNLG